MNTFKEFISSNKKKKLFLNISLLLFYTITLTVFIFINKINDFIIYPRMLIIISLCFVISSFIIWVKDMPPVRYASIAETAIVIIPSFFMFFILEPIVNNLQSLLPYAALYNSMIILAVTVIVYSISGHSGFTISICSFIFFSLYMIEYFTVIFRGTPFVLSDIFSFKTAFGVMGNYDFIINYHIIEAFYILITFSILGFYTNRKKNNIFRVAIAISGCTIGICLILFLFSDTALEKKGFSSNAFVPTESVAQNGFLLNMICTFKESLMHAPVDYSETEVRAIINKLNKTTEPLDNTPAVYPNIIVIMNESFTDMNSLETISMNEDPIANFHSLSENCIKGTLISSIFGGNTPNSEFEFLTGCTLAFFPQGSIPYQQFINTPLPSIATHLKQFGYTTSAIHLYNPTYYSRNRVYPLLGFDKFINETNTTIDIEHVNDYYATDKCSFQAIKQIYEESNGQPFFTFCVTVQNHGGYFSSPGGVNVLNVNLDHVNNYVSLLKETDLAFSELLEYFSKADTPTLIVMYGDHQPNLGQDFYEAIWKRCDYTEQEKTFMKSQVPFIIWANYDINEIDLNVTSINYLGCEVLKTAGIPMSGFYDYLAELHNTLPVISGIGYMDSDGNFFNDSDTSKYKTLLKEYEFLQYNYLKDKIEMEFYE